MGLQKAKAIGIVSEAVMENYYGDSNTPVIIFGTEKDVNSIALCRMVEVDEDNPNLAEYVKRCIEHRQSILIKKKCKCKGEV